METFITEIAKHATVGFAIGVALGALYSFLIQQVIRRESDKLFHAQKHLINELSQQLDVKEQRIEALHEELLRQMQKAAEKKASAKESGDLAP